MTDALQFDVAHLLAGSLVLVSFMLLYQSRMYALLNLFAVHAVVLSLSVAWQAYIQGAPHLSLDVPVAGAPHGEVGHHADQRGAHRPHQRGRAPPAGGGGV